VGLSLGLVRGLGSFRRWRRISRFGDPELLRVDHGVPRQVLSALLLAVAGWSATALLLPAQPSPSEFGYPTAVFCIDPVAMRGEAISVETAGQRSHQLMEAIQAAGRQLPGLRVSALVPTAGGLLHLGPTVDVDGLGMRIRSLWPEMVVRAEPADSGQDPWFRNHPEASRPGRALCLLTFRSLEDLPSADAGTYGPPGLFVVRMAVELGSRSYFTLSGSGGWVEKRNLALFCRAVHAALTPPREPSEGQTARLTATLAFAALAADWLITTLRRRPRLPAPTFVLAALVVLGTPLAARAEGLRHVTDLAPGISVIVDVSEIQPWVGQQFGIVYRLRLRVPVSAVDVDPQSFTGLWTHTIPIPEGGESGRTGSDEFLLRQLVAWPLAPGPFQIPPLRVRIQTAGGASSGLQASSEAIAGTARKVPPAIEGPDSFPMAGSLAGRLRQERRESGVWLLELQGSALVALLDPQHALRRCFRNPVTVLPAESDDTATQILEGGIRAITVVQRRRWLIVDASGSRASPTAAPSIPLFRLPAAAWSRAEVILDPGDAVSDSAGSSSSQNAPAPTNTAAGRRGVRGLVVVASSAVLLAFVVVGFRMAVRRRRAASSAGQRGA
jgi:hypothetical protein